MKILRSRILEAERRKQSEAIAGERRAQVGTGDRSERIRTYNYPQGRVTDHRIGLTLYRLEAILNGDLDELIDALITRIPPKSSDRPTIKRKKNLYDNKAYNRKGRRKGSRRGGAPVKRRRACRHTDRDCLRSCGERPRRKRRQKHICRQRRPQDNPLIVHIAEIDEILPLVKNFDERARALAEAYWPGPLTMILPKSDIIPNEVCAGLDTVAIRMPSHPIAHEIIKKCGFPLAAPSANTSGKPSPTTAAHVMNDMDGKIAAVVDGGSCSVGVESTVVTLACPVPRVLRPGGVTPDQLRAVLGEVEIDKAVFKALESGEKVLSPGMKYKHYSPNAHVIIVKGDFDKFASLVAEPRSERTCAVCFDGEEDKISVPAYPYGHADSPEEQARELFDVLRHVDDEKMELAFVRFPSLDGVGMAVYNRLLRAAGFEVIEL